MTVRLRKLMVIYFAACSGADATARNQWQRCFEIIYLHHECEIGECSNLCEAHAKKNGDKLITYACNPAESCICQLQCTK